MARPLRFFFREPSIDTNRPLSSGEVGVENFAFETVGSMKDADAWDCSFAKRLSEFGLEPGLVSIPAFPNRKFRHSYIFVSSRAGIDAPRDLEGKRRGAQAAGTSLCREGWRRSREWSGK